MPKQKKAPVNPQPRRVTPVTLDRFIATPAMAADIKRLAAAMEFMGDAVSELVDGGNEDLPGFAANGFAVAMRWAGEQLKEVLSGAEPLPAGGGGR
jgi:hypothetical protein